MAGHLGHLLPFPKSFPPSLPPCFLSFPFPKPNSTTPSTFQNLLEPRSPAEMPSSPAAVVLQATMDGDLPTLRKMAKRFDLRRFEDSKGQNLLRLAAKHGCMESCKFLVEESGLDVNSVCHQGDTPVLLAASDGNIDVLTYLLDRGGDPAIPDERGITPLHRAAQYGHVEAITLLLSKGVLVDPMFYGGTPMHLAALQGQDQVLKVLLKHGADPNRVFGHMISPLMTACQARSLKCMKLLIEAGVDVNDRRSGEGITPLEFAVYLGWTDVVKFLLEAGADPNIPGEVTAPQDGEIPIMVAAANDQRELVEILFPRTKPIPCHPDWSVDGIIRTMRFTCIEPQDAVPVEKLVSDAKSNGKEAFVKGDYLSSMYFYTQALENVPLDATLFANRSLCWLRLREGEKALCDAQQCRTLCPGWSKAWYREGSALSLLKDYEGAVGAFGEALKLDPMSDEVKNAFREVLMCLNSE